jgi:Fe-S cluster biosynthesis and repair protein YggX
MAATVQCRRCGQLKPALARAPMPGALGETIRTSICADCWSEWTRAEVMVINEMRLNFMDPEAQKVLERHMREFLFPEG